MKRVLALSVAIIGISALSVQAQDRVFARTYTTAVLPKGNIDLEFWHTSRFGHSGQFYHAQDQRMEVEFGLGGDLQTAFYFNRYQERFSETADGTETKNEIGFSNEWKWRVANPYKKKFGLALYGEWGIKGGDELELETKVIVDKIIGRSIFSFNAVGEYEKEFEWENGKLASNEWAAPVEFDLAYLFSIKQTFGIGFELRDHNEISKEHGWEHSVVFGGPTLSFSGNNWFIIANYLPQWGNLHKTSVAPGNKVLDGLERAEARILLGISIK
jgi:hypothetical protein